MSTPHLPQNHSAKNQYITAWNQWLILLVGDWIATSIAFVAALWLTAWVAREPFEVANLFDRPAWLYGLVPFWLVLLSSLYSARTLTTHRVVILRNLLLVSAVALILYGSIFFLAPRIQLPRLVVLLFIMLAFSFTGVWRFTFIAIIANRVKRIFIVGAGKAGELISQTITSLASKEYNIIGFIDDNPELRGKTQYEKPILGNHHQLIELAQTHQIALVVLAITGKLDGGLIQALADCSEYSIDVTRMTDLYEHITSRVPIYHLEADWIISSLGHSTNESWLGRSLTRLFDIVGAIVGLVVLGFLSIPVALSIWLETGGPIFYKQIRSGRGGQPFLLYKFRTMLPDAEADGFARWAEPDDQRVTKVGWFLRKLRIDEMPQFWNVLKGEMSIIGPRPERPEFIQMLESRIPFYRARLLLKPGITGWAQVNYGYASSVDNTALKLEYDLYYIKQRSLLLDLLILWRTWITVLQFQGT